MRACKMVPSLRGKSRSKISCCCYMRQCLGGFDFKQLIFFFFYVFILFYNKYFFTL